MSRGRRRGSGSRGGGRGGSICFRGGFLASLLNDGIRASKKVNHGDLRVSNDIRLEIKIAHGSTHTESAIDTSNYFAFLVYARLNLSTECNDALRFVKAFRFVILGHASRCVASGAHPSVNTSRISGVGQINDISPIHAHYDRGTSRNARLHHCPICLRNSKPKPIRGVLARPHNRRDRGWQVFGRVLRCRVSSMAIEYAKNIEGTRVFTLTIGSPCVLHRRPLSDRLCPTHRNSAHHLHVLRVLASRQAHRHNRAARACRRVLNDFVVVRTQLGTESRRRRSIKGASPSSLLRRSLHSHTLHFILLLLTHHPTRPCRRRS